jgi:hypothetical protein
LNSVQVTVHIISYTALPAHDVQTITRSFAAVMAYNAMAIRQPIP